MNIYVLACALLCMAWTCNDMKPGLTNSDTSTEKETTWDDDDGGKDSDDDEDDEGDDDDDEKKGYDDDGEEEEIPAFPPEHFLQHEKFDLNQFDETSIIIDNEWMPMEPGSQQTYRGMDFGDDGEKIEHSLISTATDLTKVIAGVNCVVLFERDYTEGGVLEEAELAFFAQDKAGNVWHFGQYVEHYDEDFFEGGRVWVKGAIENAHAGIYMSKNPQVGDRSYSMGYAPAPFNWADRFITHETGKEYKNGFGKYTNVLATREYSHEEPNAFQLKYYASGIGNVGIGFIGDDPNGETMDLIESKQLNEKELEETRNYALELEARASVYGNLNPAKVRANK